MEAMKELVSHKRDYKPKGQPKSPLAAFLTKRNTSRANQFATQRDIIDLVNQPASSGQNTGIQSNSKNSKGRPSLQSTGQTPKNKNQFTPLENNRQIPGGTQMKDKLDLVHSSLANLTTMVSEFVSIHKGLDERVKTTENAMYQVSSQINLHDQRALNSKMRISGMTITNEANPIDDVMRLFATLNINVQSHEILKAYTTRERHGENYVNAVVVIFLHEIIKDRIIMEKISKDNVAPTVYFNHVMTKINAQIHKESRKLLKEKKLYKAGFMDGKIYVIPQPGDRKHWIGSFDELYAAVGEAALRTLDVGSQGIQNEAVGGINLQDAHHSGDSNQ